MCGREADYPISRACTNEYEVCGPWEDVVGEYASGHAAGYAEAVADVDALRAALAEARTVLSLCKTARIRGTPEYRMVSAIGDELGYGAIMSAASSAWAEMFDGTPQQGSQHTCGPSEVTVRSAIARIDEVLSPGAHVGAAKKGGGG